MSNVNAKVSHTDGELLLLWSLPVVIVIWIFCFLAFPGFVSPMSPSMTPDEVSSYYFDEKNLSSIRYSMIVFNWFAVGLIPFLALISIQMKRMDHRTPILRYCFIGCIAGGPTLFTMADLFWLIAAFRPERNPEIIQMLNDLAWITFTCQVGYLFSQNVFLAVAIYLDRKVRPVFPLWVGHFNLVAAAVMIPAAFSPLFEFGPLAWDGIVSFWVKNTAIGIWIVVMLVMTAKSIYRRRKEEISEGGLVGVELK
jgi:hypothetical protein